jgi:hypothetical protein
MGKVEIKIRIDETLLARITEMGLDVSDYLERAAKKNYEKMHGGPIEDDK